jgi:hypothetical protein
MEGTGVCAAVVNWLIAAQSVAACVDTNAYGCSSLVTVAVATVWSRSPFICPCGYRSPPPTQSQAGLPTGRTSLVNRAGVECGGLGLAVTPGGGAP